MSATETKALIARAIERLQEEVPAFGQVKLVIKLELRARGGDTPIWRVEVPGPNSSLTPSALRAAMSSGGMMPPPNTTTSSAPFSRKSSSTRWKR